MFRVLLSFVLTAFLFMGILTTTGNLISESRNSVRNVDIQQIKQESGRISMREIETISASYNYSFTYKNALK